MKTLIAAAAASLALAAAAAPPASASAQATPKPSRMAVEIYRIAPGQQEAFLRLIALYDQANHAAGLPPRQLYVHQDGADWDFLIIQPEDTTPEQDRRVDAELKRLGAPQGAKFFLEVRKFIASHTDTVASGPTTAADWLSQLKP